jgi:hypothetical protein
MLQPQTEELERLEAAFLRSPSLDWPLPSPAEPGSVELPPRRTPEETDGPEALMTKYRTFGACCR